MEAHKENRTFDSGAVRDGGKKPALHLISPHAMNRLGEWLRFACEDRQPEPYPVRNWEQGLPFSTCIASLQRHVEKFKLGSTNEDHIAAMLFNAMALAHYEEEIEAGRLPADLDDMPHYLGEGLRLTRTVRQGRQVCDVYEPVEPLEQKVQADLDRTFKNSDTVYAVEDIVKKTVFWIWAGEAFTDRTRSWRGVPIDAYVPTGHAMENLPKGAPIRIMGTDRGIGVPMYEVGMDLGAPGEDKSVTRIVERPPFTVYLCGPITGQSIDYDWRKQAADLLADAGIKTLDPLRGKKPEDVTNQGLSYKGQLAAPEIAERDRLDIEEADVVLAYFPYTPPRQSIGSLMEMGAAAIGFKKPVILCSDQRVFNEHLFCRNFCTLESDFRHALERIVAMAAVHCR